MLIFLIILYTFFIVNESKSWGPDEIKNPFTNAEFCQVVTNELSIICDPENQLSVPLKKTLSKYLLHTIPLNTPCFCDRDCSSFDYTKRLLIGIVIISSINEKSMNCSKDTIYNCFSERVLQNWNISQCSGNNGLILVINKQIHLYFGRSARKKIQSSCLVHLESQIRQTIPLSYNLRVIFTHTLFIYILEDQCVKKSKV